MLVCDVHGNDQSIAITGQLALHNSLAFKQVFCCLPLVYRVVDFEGIGLFLKMGNTNFGIAYLLFTEIILKATDS